MGKVVIFTFVLVLGVLGNFAHGQIDDFTFGGYGSFVLGQQTETMEYLGYDNKLSAKQDTLVGFQVRSQLSEKLAFTAQFVADGQDDFDTQVEWAYGTYSYSDELDLRIGKLRIPWYLYSDSLLVGYSYLWVRPPPLVYRLDFDTMTGFDVLYDYHLGNDWLVSLQGFFGRFDESLELEDVGAFNLDLAPLYGLNATVGNDWLSFRMAYNYADYDIGTLEAVLPVKGALLELGFEQMADLIPPMNDSAAFIGLALSADLANWQLVAEYTEFKVDKAGFGPDNDAAWYLMLARRFDDLTLHITYSRVKSKPKLSHNQLPGIDEFAELSGAFNSIVMDNQDDTEISFGTRYEISPGLALKLEATHYTTRAASSELSNRSQDGVLFNFGLEFVF